MKDEGGTGLHPEENTQQSRIRRSKVEENTHRAAAIFHERLATFYISVAKRLLTEAEDETRFAQHDWERAPHRVTDRRTNAVTSSPPTHADPANRRGSSSSPSRAFHSRYAEAFERFVRERNERSLRAAYELGRDAVTAGLSILEIAGVHHESLAQELAVIPGKNVDDVCQAAGDFLVESLAAYEMVQRGFSDARRAALVERRNARILRQLSTLLADQALAAGDHGSLEEVLQIVAEQIREMTDSHRASVQVVGGVQSVRKFDMESDSNGGDTWSEMMQPRERIPPASPGERHATRAPLLALDGANLGWLKVERDGGKPFTPTDNALIKQVAEMTAAAVERALVHA